MYPCTVCGIEFENRNSMANHVRWKHKEKKFSDKGYVNIKRTAWKHINDNLGCRLTILRICMKCKNVYHINCRSKKIGKNRLRKFCSRRCANSHGPETYTEKTRNLLRIAAKANPEWTNNSGRVIKNNRFSSRAERELAEKLGSGFQRHLVIKAKKLTFDIDIASLDGRIWIESDGPYHFEKVHKGHDYERTKLRDLIEENEAHERNILLIRVNNLKYSIEEQLDFINDSIEKWDFSASLKKLY